MPVLKTEPREKLAMPLTKKQKHFADEYLRTGNGTIAALEAYDTTNRKVAGVISAENLTRHRILKYINEQAETMAHHMKKLARDAKSEAVQFQATKDILDRAGYKPIEQVEQKNTEISASISEETFKKFLEEFQK